MEKIEIEQKIVEMIKTVYDPEIPVNIYDLGLIYRIELKEDNSVDIDMTLTAPNCPAADRLSQTPDAPARSYSEEWHGAPPRW